MTSFYQNERYEKRGFLQKENLGSCATKDFEIQNAGPGRDRRAANCKETSDQY
jgi:hypothetical protein